MDARDKDAAVLAQLRKIMQGHGDPALRVLDLRELEAPEPLERALLAASQLTAGERLVVWTPRMPQPLLVRLRERGLAYVALAADDGSALIHIERP